MRQKKDVILAYFAMMLVEKQRTCRSIFVDVVALYRAGLRATTVRCYYLSLLLCEGTALPRQMLGEEKLFYDLVALNTEREKENKRNCLV